MTACRTIAEVLAAADAADNPPHSQELADLVAAILAPGRAGLPLPWLISDSPAAAGARALGPDAR